MSSQDFPVFQICRQELLKPDKAINLLNVVFLRNTGYQRTYYFILVYTFLQADRNRENMDSNHNEFIKIGSFIDIFQANMAKEILQSNGISCVVTGDEFRLFDFSPEDNIPVQLIINRNDKDTAQELLILHFNN